MKFWKVWWFLVSLSGLIVGKARAEVPHKNVLMVHLDGINAKVFTQMLSLGQLPHFSELIQRGKFSPFMSTVDKSETMKVVQSYLTSRVDQKIAGWWQFERDEFRFYNTWMGANGVINFAIGDRYPLYPTVLDFLNAEGKTLLSGFALSRRGVNFQNYTRNYKEGLKGVYEHEYYRQMEATVDEFLKRYSELISEEKYPSLSTLVLAAVDEHAHMLGVTTEKIAPPTNPGASFVPYCLKQGVGENANPRKAIFEFLNQEKNPRALNTLDKVAMKDGIIDSFCVKLPVIEVQTSTWKRVNKVVHPDTVLATLLLDWQIGKLIDFHKSKGLFEHTYWVFFGDHGMVDCKKKMIASTEEDVEWFERHKDSQEMTFIEWINQRQGLITKKSSEKTFLNELIGIDDALVPSELNQPFKVASWQSPSVRSDVADVQLWGEQFYGKLTDLLRTELSDKYWFLSYFRNLFVFPKFDKYSNQYRDKVVDFFTTNALESSGDYKREEKNFKHQFFNQHVRLVYGGGARHNAEIFIPHTTESGGMDWGRRATFDEIVHYKATPQAKETLLETLLSSPAVSLAFIRLQNDEMERPQAMPRHLDILVMDKVGRRGWVSVERNDQTLEKKYCYKSETATDPLYHSEEFDRGVCGDYHWWHHEDVLRNSQYHGGVAGLGAYLYSQGTAIGDILLMHEADWNFYENSGGHGGIHFDEKITVGIISGPGIERGELLTVDATFPTILDVAPTALKLLGYSENSLDDFARSGEFLNYWKKWNAGQKQDILDNLFRLKDWKEVENYVGVGIDIRAFRRETDRFLDFILTDPEVLPLPDYQAEKIDGKLLNVF